MTSSRPYLLRALYEWIVDNGMTPHVLVDAARDDVEVPSAAIRDGKIVLNVSPGAVRDLVMDNDCVSFVARFSGVTHGINIPAEAVMAIYARENGQGMMFPEDDGDGGGGPEGDGNGDDGDSSSKKPNLKVVK